MSITPSTISTRPHTRDSGGCALPTLLHQIPGYLRDLAASATGPDVPAAQRDAGEKTVVLRPADVLTVHRVGGGQGARKGRRRWRGPQTTPAGRPAGSCAHTRGAARFRAHRSAVLSSAGTVPPSAQRQPTDVLPPTTTGAFRIWLFVGLTGLGLLIGAPRLAAAWRIDLAGLALNRQLYAADRAQIPSILALLGNADGPHDASFWRTYGLAASWRPSEAAFRRLKAARDRGELDRIGQLWFGEVAAATNHWSEADEAYTRLDTVNLLVERGDTALEAGKKDMARDWYAAAAAGMRAALKRGPQPSGASQGNRAISLLRIGRGFLALDWPEAALPVLEMALTEMQVDPPGVREQQTIMFTMGQALAKNELSKDDRAHVVQPAALRPPGSVKTTTETRIHDLLARSSDLDHTGWTELQTGHVLALVGNRSGAMTHLRAALRLDPRLPDAYLILGALLQTGGLTNLARDVYAQGVKALPENEPIRVAWALAAFQTLPPEQSLPILEEVADTPTRDPYLFAALGDTYLALGRDDDAAATYRAGLRRSPGAKTLTERLARFADPFWKARS